ncbi:hypothetical protein BGZ63DRAFT_380801 [Mariannaea sp. PMI_226]|nr:hypothetical protein BGZ63DRAFT_380801 [Mariannaea sp. PMI_226]
MVPKVPKMAIEKRFPLCLGFQYSIVSTVGVRCLSRVVWADLSSLEVTQGAFAFLLPNLLLCHHDHRLLSYRYSFA